MYRIFLSQYLIELIIILFLKLMVAQKSRVHRSGKESKSLPNI